MLLRYDIGAAFLGLLRYNVLQHCSCHGIVLSKDDVLALAEITIMLCTHDKHLGCNSHVASQHAMMLVSWSASIKHGLALTK